MDPELAQRQRRGVFRLVALAAAVLMLTVSTRPDAQADAPPAAEQPPISALPSALHTAAAGSAVRLSLPEEPPARFSAPADCLHRWWLLEPELIEPVEVTLRWEGEALVEVRVLEHSVVPPGPAACLAEAIVGIAPVGVSRMAFRR